MQQYGSNEIWIELELFITQKSTISGSAGSKFFCICYNFKLFMSYMFD